MSTSSSPPAPQTKGSMGVRGALALGIGGIIGGGFFATFGLGVVGARGATFISFLVGGAIALLTAYAYVKLTIRYPGPGGTVSFIHTAFGGGLFGASINRLLIFSYVALMAVYARALGGYSASYFPVGDQETATRLVAAAGIVVLALVNLAGDSVMDVFSDVFNVSKLGALAIFIIGGFLLGHPSWDRLAPSNWVPFVTIVSNGMVVFLAYEGFELIANASDDIKDPARTLPIAYYGSVVTAIVIYVLSVIVAIGHMPIAAMEQAKTFALSATAGRFMGAFGFGLMTFGAVTASASAINADLYGSTKLPVLLSEGREMLPVFGRSFRGRHVPSMASIMIGAVLAVYFVNLHALSAVTSGGFLIVFGAVNYANVRLAGETNSRKWISIVATLACVAALGIMLYDFASSAATRSSAYAVGVVVMLSVASVLLFKVTEKTFGRETR